MRAAVLDRTRPRTRSKPLDRQTLRHKAAKRHADHDGLFQREMVHQAFQISDQRPHGIGRGGDVRPAVAAGIVDKGAIAALQVRQNAVPERQIGAQSMDKHHGGGSGRAVDAGIQADIGQIDQGHGSAKTAKGIGEQGRVHIAARGCADHGVGQVVAEQGGGKGDGAAGFDHDAQVGEGQCHGVQRLVIADNQTGAAETVQDGKGDLAGRRGDDGIADRAGQGGVALDVARCQRTGGVVKARRFGRADTQARVPSRARAMPAVNPPPPQQVMTSAAPYAGLGGLLRQFQARPCLGRR